MTDQPSPSKTPPSKFATGGRYILKDRNNFCRSEFEATVVEVSPSGKRVKLKYGSNVFQWEDPKDFSIVERLP